MSSDGKCQLAGVHAFFDSKGPVKPPVAEPHGFKNPCHPWSYLGSLDRNGYASEHLDRMIAILRSPERFEAAKREYERRQEELSLRAGELKQKRVQLEQDQEELKKAEWGQEREQSELDAGFEPRDDAMVIAGVAKGSAKWTRKERERLAKLLSEFRSLAGKEVIGFHSEMVMDEDENGTEPGQSA